MSVPYQPQVDEDEEPRPCTLSPHTPEDARRRLELSGLTGDATAVERHTSHIVVVNEPTIQEAPEDGATSGSEVSKPQYMEQRRFHNRWPRGLGIWMAVVGFLSVLLGISEVFIIPLFEDKEGTFQPHLDVHNTYGMGMWAGSVLILTGCMAIRAAIGKRASTVYRFFLLTVLCLLLYVVAQYMLLAGFIEQKTVPASYKSGSALFYIHVATFLSVFLGFILCIASVVQYYETVLCGELQLCRRCFFCCFPCCCRAVNGHG
ncbi:uncharacterized protein LOC106169862 isoform X2 [Lingula anatina]|uniref:Uncharacterized protein LOC106169862 isoform X2 n=1 Tax=Lingula anatina TaxID=7574 RepID=A0A1S3J3V6_LINAN|nr:uncharacterized protein LOC106169862 isoform X2 [Lingula anatina]|eukprot:XP_013404948.1 uncharacterized protein LOC106169862 isoform X2 [Lingula anatina]